MTRPIIPVFCAAFLFIISLASPSTSDAQLVSVEGCVFNKNTGETVSGTFVIRTFTRSGNGGAGSHTGGCYSGLNLGDPSPDQWDFIEVLFFEEGHLYVQQLKLDGKATAAGFTFLGLPENTMRYDFFLDILPPSQ